MDHETAVQTHASERYLLGEFSPDERDQFEEHFFTCPECAEDVRMATIFSANARAVFRDQSRKPRQTSGLLDFLSFRPAYASSILANCVLLLIAGLLFWKSERPMAPGFYPTFFMPAAARSGGNVFEVSAEAGVFGANFDLTGTFDRYEYEILNESGVRQALQKLPAPRSSATELSLIIPTSHLRPGQYTLSVRGFQGSKSIYIAKSNFKFIP
jgi:hypothetical protein